MKVFAKKITALKYLKPNNILCNDNINKYFILKDYNSFSELIKSQDNPNYYEFIPENKQFNIFLDIEIYKEKNPEEWDNSQQIILGIIETFKTKTNSLFEGTCKFIILESHLLDIKLSYHIIIRTFKNDIPIYFKNIKGLKKSISNIFPDLTVNKIIDLSVYREGLFRTFLSSKSDEDKPRPLVKSSFSEDFEFLETFVCYTPNIDNSIIFDSKDIEPHSSKQQQQIQKENHIENHIENLIETTQKNLTHTDKDIIKKFVRKNYKYRNTDFREIFINKDINSIIVSLNDTFCFNLDREHKSNHQYIVIDTYSSKQKCHDIDCSNFKHNEIKFLDFPKELNEIILKCLKVNKKEQELIQKAIEECKDYITENFDNNIHEISFDKSEMVFKSNVSQNSVIKMTGKCPECHIEHQIGDNGYCLKCKICKSIFPKNTLIPIDDRYKHLNNFFVNYNQLVNNGTVNINIQNNYYNNEDFSCDIELSKNIIKDNKLTKIYNQVLDGHKITKLAEVIYYLNKDFVYTKNHWYYFNGSIWKSDEDNLNMKRIILDNTTYLNKISNHYENDKSKDGKALVKNVKNLITKINKPGFKDDIIKEAKMFFNDQEFISKLNSKKHLIPFTDGVFDLINRQFRKTSKDDYVNLTVNYPYNSNLENKEVYKFLNEVLPDTSVRDYVLKKMSECLNGDIPNTNFLMFIGDTGANGKSQLLNLMKLAMGEFGEKVEVTLLTRKRNNANESNSEKIKLMNKRFAFLSEPEDGEKINIGLLKELTGSEEIVARGLYQESVSFVMEAKLFLACNELPEIKGEDTALWRRIRAIDFPSRFLDNPNPTEPGEYKIDRTLPSRMREDIRWRQTFMKILIDYYYRDNIQEPEQVKIKTNEYRQENNDFFNWLNENVEYNQNSLLQTKDVCEIYLNKSKMFAKELSKYKREIEKWIKERFKNQNIQWQYSTVRISDKLYKGWKDFHIKDT
jgi:P4 family phage/plasmid primase-like protien